MAIAVRGGTKPPWRSRTAPPIYYHGLETCRPQGECAPTLGTSVPSRWSCLCPSGSAPRKRRSS